jgi:hypothetical protein
MPLKRPKKSKLPKGTKGFTGIVLPPQTSDQDDYDFDSEAAGASIDNVHDPDVDLNNPNLTIPLARYNAMLAVLRNTLFMFVKWATT